VYRSRAGGGNLVRRRAVVFGVFGGFPSRPLGGVFLEVVRGPGQGGKGGLRCVREGPLRAHLR